MCASILIQGLAQKSTETQPYQVVSLHKSAVAQRTLGVKANDELGPLVAKKV